MTNNKKRRTAPALSESGRGEAIQALRGNLPSLSGMTLSFRTYRFIDFANHPRHFHQSPEDIPYISRASRKSPWKERDVPRALRPIQIVCKRFAQCLRHTASAPPPIDAPQEVHPRTLRLSRCFPYMTIFVGKNRKNMAVLPTSSWKPLFKSIWVKIGEDYMPQKMHLCSIKIMQSHWRR